MGADEPGKQEVEPSIFSLADTIVVDSKEQALKFGDLSYALKLWFVDLSNVEELGVRLTKNKQGPKTMITDLTGIAAQDSSIANLALQYL